MRNPFKVPTTQTVLIRVHKSLATAIKKETKRQQRIADSKFNKKYKVSSSFASKVIGGMLK